MAKTKKPRTRRRVVVSEPEATFVRDLPHSRQQQLYMDGHEVSALCNGSGPDERLWGTPTVEDGIVRTPTRHPMFSRSTASSYVCVIEHRTNYGWTSAAVCAHRFIIGMKYRGRLDEVKANLTDTDQIMEVCSISGRRHCLKCPLMLEWFGHDNKLEE